MRIAPSPQAHIRHFLATVEDCEAMAAEHPIGDDRWHVALHAMMLRKYFQPSDSLALPKVVTSLRECSNSNALEAKVWECLLASVATVGDIMERRLNEGKPRGESELLRHQLYGRYLDGDYDKWMETQKMGTASDLPLFVATGGRSSRVVAYGDEGPNQG